MDMDQGQDVQILHLPDNLNYSDLPQQRKEDCNYQGYTSQTVYHEDKA